MFITLLNALPGMRVLISSLVYLATLFSFSNLNEPELWAGTLSRVIFHFSLKTQFRDCPQDPSWTGESHLYNLNIVLSKTKQNIIKEKWWAEFTTGNRLHVPHILKSPSVSVQYQVSFITSTGLQKDEETEISKSQTQKRRRKKERKKEKRLGLPLEEIGVGGLIGLSSWLLNKFH